MRSKTRTVREYEPLTDLAPNELEELTKFALGNQTDDEQGNPRRVLTWKNGELIAQNYVGVIETRKGTVLEILPKVDFGESGEAEKQENIEEKTRKIFLKMLRAWRGLKSAQFNEANIRDVRNFNMWEVFIRLFLTNLVLLTQRGLARGYQPRESNLPCLRGRILFTPHIRENSANRARFYVGYDEFTADRPVNRLIHSALHKLLSFTREPRNQQLLHQLRLYFADIPKSKRIESDWQRHQVDRSMPHYDRVMPWVGLFLFGHGLTTFAGKHVNASMLFPMEEVFEDFVTQSFRRYQSYPVRAQSPRRSLAKIGRDEAFQMKPDISLMDPDPSLRDRQDKVKFILDAKWKRLNEEGSDSKHGINQADMYQLYSYGKQYGCKRVALIYPKTEKFTSPLEYKFGPDFNAASLKLFCFPFDVESPEKTEKSVKEIVKMMENNRAHVNG